MPWWLRCFGKSYEPPEVLELDYRHSSLTEVPPDVFTYERTLEKLSLASNQITTLPPSLFHCYELRELELYDNELLSIPAAIGTLTRLTRLDASRNGISDVADTIKNCKNLSHLDLSLNHLVKVPEGISQLICLEELNLSDTYLEYLNANFGRLTKLRVLELRDNVLQCLPKSMTRFTHLHRLDLGQNDLREIPDVLGTMANLTELFLDNNSIRSIPSFIGNLSKLVSVDCSNNDIFEIADEISKCIQLGDLSLNLNNIEGLPDSFGKLESLSVLRLDNNQIQYLPENFGHLRNLQELSVMRNLLKALPPSIGLLRKLNTLLLDENLLCDLPKEIGSCVQLSILHVAKNRLVSIPSEIGHLSNLKVISLSENCLSNLPVSILNIPKLGAIWLSESQSKPLLPLNKEVDTSTGQLVLTCFLLPQMSNSAETDSNNRRIDESVTTEKLARTRQYTIKFADIPEDLVGTDSAEEHVANSSQRPVGLFRAPTPYPKELRALAKHASQVYTKHTKEYNGDITRWLDGAVHESDLDRDVDGRILNSDGKKGKHWVERSVPSENHPLGREKTNPESVRLLPHHNERETDYRSPYDSIRRMRLGHGSGVKIGPEQSRLANGSGENVEENLPLDLSAAPRHWNSYGSSISEITAKTPPPYHVAARRAAFFRNTSTSSSNTNTSSAIETPSNMKTHIMVSHSPSSNKIFTQTGPMDSSFCQDPQQSIIEETVESTPHQSHLINVTFTQEMTPVQGNSHVNTTFTIQSPASPILEPHTSISHHDTKEVNEKEKRIIESIIRDGSTLSRSQQESLTDEIDGATDTSDGPPILPMRPITGNYLRSVTGPPTTIISFNRTISSERFSKIPKLSSKNSSDSKEIENPVQLNPTYMDPSSVLDKENHSASTVESDRSVTPVLFNSKIPVFNNPVQGLTETKVIRNDLLGPELLQLNQTEPVQVNNLRMGVDKTIDSTSHLPDYSENATMRSSFGKSKMSQKHESGGITGILAPGTIAASVTKLSKVVDPTPSVKETQIPKRGSIGSKIPQKANPSPPPGAGLIVNTSSEKQPVRDSSSPDSVISSSSSKIPTFGRKPWIFGSHRNARVVPLEYKKVNQLGFTVCNAPNTSANENGVYIDSVEFPESAVKLGDKLLQVDGIDVANMNLEIVRKILSNCQETINILVSREN